ncbi:hypothetical protein RHMOL_Rhmol09G0085800 [Rhododendron molle]|uniref:Uncharacterized protein n=1 Tax=Rhododendron molle TaxID=49168 RepID=A0ACC0MCE2_RHOML|nr:hypothetical protein RHMOL_Rhmol09G0085800 [Rhododendron molle]
MVWEEMEIVFQTRVVCVEPYCALQSRLIVLTSHLRNELLSIAGCRDEIRAIVCTIQRFEGVQYGATHLIVQYQPGIHNLLFFYPPLEEEVDNSRLAAINIQ